MEAIRTKSKVVTNLLTGEQNHVVFKDITVFYNTASNFVNVSVSIYKEVIHQLEEDGEAYNEVELILLPSLKLIDSYTNELVDQLVDDVLKTKPENIISWSAINQFIYVHGAMSIIINKGYLGLKATDLEIV